MQISALKFILPDFWQHISLLFLHTLLGSPFFFFLEEIYDQLLTMTAGAVRS